MRTTSTRRLVPVACLVVAVLAGCSSDDTTSSTTTSAGVSTTTSTTVGTTTTSVVTPTTNPADVYATAVWPTPVSSTRYRDPVAAATGFATDYVGFTKPLVGTFNAGDSRSGEVEVKPRADGPVTTVLVRQLGADNTWWVIGAGTPNIVLDQPAALSSITSPVRLRGTSTAFEANVHVEIREDGNNKALADDFVMGGSNGDLGPFDKTIAFSAPTQRSGAILMDTLSAADGSVLEVTVVRVHFGR